MKKEYKKPRMINYDISLEDIMFASNPMQDSINDIYGDVDEIF
jgi:hypothetical protein